MPLTRSQVAKRNPPETHKSGEKRKSPESTGPTKSEEQRKLKRRAFEEIKQLAENKLTKAHGLPAVRALATHALDEIKQSAEDKLTEANKLLASALPAGALELPTSALTEASASPARNLRLDTQIEQTNMKVAENAYKEHGVKLYTDGFFIEEGHIDSWGFINYLNVELRGDRYVFTPKSDVPQSCIESAEYMMSCCAKQVTSLMWKGEALAYDGQAVIDIYNNDDKVIIGNMGQLQDLDLLLQHIAELLQQKTNPLQPEAKSLYQEARLLEQQAELLQQQAEPLHPKARLLEQRAERLQLQVERLQPEAGQLNKSSITKMPDIGEGLIIVNRHGDPKIHCGVVLAKTTDGKRAIVSDLSRPSPDEVEKIGMVPLTKFLILETPEGFLEEEDTKGKVIYKISLCYPFSYTRK